MYEVGGHMGEGIWCTKRSKRVPTYQLFQSLISIFEADQIEFWNPTPPVGELLWFDINQKLLQRAKQNLLKLEKATAIPEKVK